MNIIGIDYSMTSPAICVNGEYFIFVNKEKKFEGRFKESGLFFHGIHYTKGSDSQEKRFSTIAKSFTDILSVIKPGIAYIEGYAYGAGSKGRVFEIGENTGYIKFGLQLMGWKVRTLAPTEIKKFATGSGGADKKAMADAWQAEKGFQVCDVLSRFKETKKELSPSSDIVDSYFVYKMGKSIIDAG